MPEAKTEEKTDDLPEAKAKEKVKEPQPGYDKKPASNAEEISKAPPSLRKPKGRSSLPKLQSLNALRTEVEEAETNGVKIEEDLTQESLEKAWKAYLESIDRDSVKTVLKNTSIKLEGKKVSARVGSGLAENTLRQEQALMDFLRDQMHVPSLSLKITIDTTKAPSVKAPPKPLTDSEKYWRMKSVNPLVDEVRKRFDLQIDND